MSEGTTEGTTDGRTDGRTIVGRRAPPRAPREGEEEEEEEEEESARFDSRCRTHPSPPGVDFDSKSFTAPARRSAVFWSISAMTCAEIAERVRASCRRAASYRGVASPAQISDFPSSNANVRP